ncbi:acidic fibroblast growth factor binding-domain-containing protein [Fimicolochytrium jonesii]|uniref:acidic fibroblast growth factor binding-domain-containing protein n=1 Tax=Fimicolochytrium jonesii TaxID=1396493 RepID=UPI0022FDEE91|nr:acidic fibroblast growth factor binding-domain-containing protein [Fimicolochytrium jonesii]KAI8815847.1 acidic fibroblast growth factor binding-domain-containing protein [Fimicolochytrium jonesii]
MEFSVFVPSTPVFDRSVWQLWLYGLSVDQATSFLQKKRPGLKAATGPLRNYILSQVSVWYRHYEILEPHLHRPKHLYTSATAVLFPHPASQGTRASSTINTSNITTTSKSPRGDPTRAYLIETYYSFHPSVMRYTLGKKVSSRLREDVCLKTKVPSAGCRRMFDNFKRIVKVVEDAEMRDITSAIVAEFLLPVPLAEQYAHIIFINNYRLDTFKRKLTYLKFADYEFVASVFMQRFAHPTTPILDDLDSTLSQDARDIKSLLFNQRGVLDEYKAAPPATTTSILSPTSSPDTLFKTLIRGVLSIGTSLQHRKELRDVFQTIHDRIVEPACAGANWSPKDLSVFFQVAGSVFAGVGSVPRGLRGRYAGPWKRLCEGVGRASVRFAEVYVGARREGGAAVGV